MSIAKASLAAFLMAVLAICMPVTASAQSQAKETHVRGLVVDASSEAPLPFASVTVADNASGTLTDEKGRFTITVPAAARALVVSCMGYDRDSLPLEAVADGYIEMRLQPSSIVLNEVVVKKQKYSKRNNPAVDFMRRLKEMGPLTDPLRNPHYNYDKYQVVTMALNDFGTKDNNRRFAKHFSFLWEYVDTSTLSGKPILNVAIKEKISRVHWRRDPKARKEVVSAFRQEGMDEIVAGNGIQEYIDDVMREIDLYDNDINIVHNRFVSPLSRLAPDFYKFYLTDTVSVDGEQCIVLSFYPHNRASFGFIGQVFVPLADTTMFIKKVVMRTPKDINLNFIDNMYLSQEFAKAPDGSRLKLKDNMSAELSLLPGTSGFFIRRDIAYSNHDFNAPSDSSLFAAIGDEIYLPDAKTRDTDYFDSVRTVEISDNERQISSIMTQFRKVPIFYWSEKFIELLFSGYIHTGNPSKFDIGPVNTFFSGNTLEGFRLQAGGTTTARLNRRLFASGYVARGFKDHKWKYEARLEYSFVDKDYHAGEFPVHSLRLTSLYDIDQLGQRYLYTSANNFVLSLTRQPDTQVTYHRVNKLCYTLELRNNLSFTATVGNERQEASRYVSFVRGTAADPQPCSHYDESSLEVTLRYAPGETLYQRMDERYTTSLDAPVFTVSHTIAPRRWFGSDFTVNRTEASVRKRFFLSAFGSIDVLLKGGHVWSRCPFPNLIIPNANLSYTIQPESFALLNTLEFATDSYASLDLTYWVNGALLNLIPGVKKLKLREVLGFKGFWGHLSDNNNPELHPELFRFPMYTNSVALTGTPYMEASVGIDNIFKVLRLDYVWRLTYLDVPYKIDRSGLRLSVHISF